MAKSNNIVKPDSKALVLVQPKLKGKGMSEMNQLIDKAVMSVRNVVQSLTEAEPNVASAATAAFDHAKKHGDTTPADRLMKGILNLNHPAAKAVAFELMSWFRDASPIRWNPKTFEVFINKDPNNGPVEYNPEKASEAAYHETAKAKKARAIGSAAHANTLKEADSKMLLNRAAGVITFFNNIITGKDERKIKAGEEEKMRRIAEGMNTLLKDFGGEEATVTVASATSNKVASPKAA